MFDFTRLRDLDLTKQTVLIRADLNVPIQDGKITSFARIDASVPTIRHALEQGARVIVMSHRGRPTEGDKADDSTTLAPIADVLSEKLSHPVKLVSDYLSGVTFDKNEILLLENVRLNSGEKKNDEALAQKLASLCDIFVHDAFGTAHRAQASTHGVAKYAKQTAAGLLLEKELDSLQQALHAPEKPLMAIVGGSKVSTKLDVLKTLAETVDVLIVGGGIANTFIKAAGYEVGKSLYEPELVQTAKDIMDTMQKRGAILPLPTDVVVADGFDLVDTAATKSVENVTSTDAIFDVGPNSAKALATLAEKAGTIVWNGPLGVFEKMAFAQGTDTLTKAIANSNAFSIAGGGDTIAAIEQFGAAESISYISTGGGAFLEFLEGKTLPAVAILNERHSK